MKKLFTALALFMLIGASTTLQAQNPTFNFTDATACLDGDFEVDITVENFVNITSFQFASDWDMSVIDFSEVTFIHPSFSTDIVVNVNEGEQPELAVSWVDFNPDISNAGVSLDDDMVIMTLSFTAIADNGASSMMSFNSTEVSARIDNDVMIVDADFMSATATIAQPEMSMVVVDNDIDNTGVGSIDITVDSGTAPYSYDWSNGADTEDLMNLTADMYTAVVTDANGCESTFGPFAVDNIVNTNEIKGLERISMFPNPASDQVRLQLQLQNAQRMEIAIFNILGKKVSSLQQESAIIDVDLDLSRLTAGHYFVQISTEDGAHVERLEIVR